MKLSLKTHGYPGKLIVIEGMDGSGKTTIEQRIVEHFGGEGIGIFVTHQPSAWFRNDERILATLFGDGEGEIIADEAVALFGLADRFNHQKLLLEPQLARGAIVLCNRYIFAMLSYYIASGTVDLQWLKDVSHFVIKPDLVILLNADPKIIVDRVIGKDGKNPNYYDQDEGMVRRIMNGYLELAASNDIHVVSTAGDEDTSFQACARLMEAALRGDRP